MTLVTSLTQTLARRQASKETKGDADAWQEECNDDDDDDSDD